MFFACNGKEDKDGELILCQDQKSNYAEEIDYGNYPNDIKIIKPKPTGDSRNRVIFQNSVFIYAPKGYIPSDKYKHKEVPKRLKKPILDYLKEFHNINVNTIYNDLIGFIENKKKLIC